MSARRSLTPSAPAPAEDEEDTLLVRLLSDGSVPEPPHAVKPAANAAPADATKSKDD